MTTGKGKEPKGRWTKHEQLNSSDEVVICSDLFDQQGLMIKNNAFRITRWVFPLLLHGFPWEY
jgi:hypothetical protein